MKGGNGLAKPVDGGGNCGDAIESEGKLRHGQDGRLETGEQRADLLFQVANGVAQLLCLARAGVCHLGIHVADIGGDDFGQSGGSYSFVTVFDELFL